MAVQRCRLLLLALVGAAFVAGCRGANILGVFTSMSPSHLIVQMSMVKVLAEHGHNVTVVTSLKPIVGHKDIRVIQVPLSAEDDRRMGEMIAKMVASDNSNIFVSMFRMIGQTRFMFEKMRAVMLDERVRNLYENPDNSFDLAIVGFFLNNYQLGIAHKLQVPVIMAASMPPSELFSKMLGSATATSYVPVLGGPTAKGQPMTFVQRLKNFAGSIALDMFMFLMERFNEQDYKIIYGDDPGMPPYSELTKNVSLVFFGSHALSEGPIRANVPAIVEVGGIHIKETPSPLPPAMDEFLRDARDGAILLSLGSNVRGAHLRPDTVQKMFTVLSQLRQRVIWKWEDLEHTPGPAANIMYSQWLPQDDLLAHPRVVLFITHAGKGGITEAQYHGKPMLALPVFGDQPNNAQKMVADGFGLSLSLLQLDQQQFRDTIEELLTNPQYAQRVKAFSALYRDRPLSAAQTVLYWTEYVLRHRGAAHLQSPLLHMSFIAANNLDVYGLLLMILLLLAFMAKSICALAYRKLRAKSRKLKQS